jgi:hypothetical protein
MSREIACACHDWVHASLHGEKCTRIEHLTSRHRSRVATKVDDETPRLPATSHQPFDKTEFFVIFADLERRSPGRLPP